MLRLAIEIALVFGLVTSAYYVGKGYRRDWTIPALVLFLFLNVSLLTAFNRAYDSAVDSEARANRDFSELYETSKELEKLQQEEVSVLEDIVDMQDRLIKKQDKLIKKLLK